VQIGSLIASVSRVWEEKEEWKEEEEVSTQRDNPIDGSRGDTPLRNSSGSVKPRKYLQIGTIRMRFLVHDVVLGRDRMTSYVRCRVDAPWEAVIDRLRPESQRRRLARTYVTDRCECCCCYTASELIIIIIIIIIINNHQSRAHQNVSHVLYGNLRDASALITYQLLSIKMSDSNSVCRQIFLYS